MTQTTPISDEQVEALRVLEKAATRYYDAAKEHFSDTDYDRDGLLAEADAELWVIALPAARAALTAAASIPASRGVETEGENGELDAGINYAIERLCEILDVDPKSINWDAATETMDGDVSSVICNVLIAAYGEEWSSKPEDTARIRKVLVEQADAEKPRNIAKRAARDLVAAMASKDPLIRDLIMQTARVLAASPAPQPVQEQEPVHRQFRLQWDSPPKPPVHPKTMRCSYTTSTYEGALKVLAGQGGATLVSLVEIDSYSIDRTEEARAALGVSP